MRMKSVRRFDIGSLRRPERMPNGWLRVDAYLTRSGIFTYRNPDGTERRELRTDAEVFKGASMATFGLVPVTNDHPPTLLTADNTKDYMVGTVGENVRRDGDKIRASLLVTDSATIAAMEAGKTQLSCGYTCDLDFTPGEWNGQRYDAVQKNIRGNHVALVEVGRAGPEASARMDSADAVMVPAPDTGDSMKIRIDGVDYEVSEQVAQAIEKALAAATAKTDALTSEVANKDAAHKAELDALQAKLDATAAKLDSVEKARTDAADPAKFQAAVAARVALEVEAKKHLGEETKFDGQSDTEVKIAVIEKLAGKALDRKDESYVAVRFDAELDVLSRRNPALEGARVAANEASRTDSASATDEKAARARMMEENRNRWKTVAEGKSKK